MIIRRGLLYAVLTQFHRLIDRHASIPALHHVKLESLDGTTLRIEATDLTTHTNATISCDGKFSACLPAKALTEFVKPDDAQDRYRQVELLPEGEDKVTIAVEAALTTMTVLPSKDFPARPGDKHGAKAWQDAGSWRAGALASGLGWVSLAAGTDETRRHLTGLLFARDEVVGLDGHRLHLVRMSGLDGGVSTLVASKSIAALLRILPTSGEVTALRAKDSIRFRCSNGNVQWELETQAITDVQFPPYNQVIPAEGNETFRAEVDREALVRGIARMPKSRDKRHVGVRVIVNGAIKIERDGDEGVASCTVPVLSTTHEGADSTLGVSAAYLADALSCSAPIIIGRFGGELDPIRLDLGPDKLAVIMPMRL